MAPKKIARMHIVIAPWGVPATANNGAMAGPTLRVQTPRVIGAFCS